MANQRTSMKESIHTLHPVILDVAAQNLSFFMSPLLTVKFTDQKSIFPTPSAIMHQPSGEIL